MPNSITIVSPVNGETILAAAVMNVSVDYEYVYSTNRYIGGNCTTGGGHSGFAGPIGTGDDSAEVGLGTHSAAYTGVELTARIQDSNVWNSPYVAQASVNNITITADPVIQLDPNTPPPPMPYYRVGRKSAGIRQVTDQWALDFGVAFDPATNVAKLDREYDEKTPPVLKGSVKKVEQYLKGQIIGIVNGRIGKTGLVGVYTLDPVADVKLDVVTGLWEVTLPVKVLASAKVPRQIILVLLDKAGEFAATISAPLLKKA